MRQSLAVFLLKNKVLELFRSSFEVDDSIVGFRAELLR